MTGKATIIFINILHKSTLYSPINLILKIRPSSLKNLYQSFKLHFEEQVLNSHDND